MKNLFISLILSLGLAFALVPQSSAQVTEAAITADGVGVSRDAAIEDALVSAASQAFGVRLNSSSISNNVQLDAATDDEEHNVMISSLNKVIQKELNSPQNAPILGYDILSIDQFNDNEWQATVELRYAKYEQIGSDSNRRSVVVTSKNKRYKQMLIETVSESVVNSRRFDVLNRENDEFFQDEKMFIMSSDAGAAEMSRLSQASGADYLIIADLPSLGISNNQRETIHMTGEVLVKSSVSGALRLQVIEFSSRKLKWQGTEKFGATYKDVSAIGPVTLSKLINNAANVLIDKMVAAIYPIRVVKTMGNKIIINRGEGSVTKGQVFAVFAEGEELIDPQSGESLGSMETEIGIGEVIDVKPKFAFVQMANGVTIDASDIDYILRATDKKIVKPKKPVKKAAPKPAKPSLKDAILNN